MLIYASLLHPNYNHDNAIFKTKEIWMLNATNMFDLRQIKIAFHQIQLQ